MHVFPLVFSLVWESMCGYPNIWKIFLCYCNSYLSTWFSCGFFTVFKFLQLPIWNAFKNTKNSFSITVSCLLKDQRLFNIADLHLNYLLYKFILMAFTVFWSLSKYNRWKFAFVLTTELEWKNVLGRDKIPEALRLLS